jgi:hypothetical protein
MAEIKELLDVSSSTFLLFFSARKHKAGKECFEISYFDIDLQNDYTMVLCSD